ncbi:vWA domain-containing protein [Oscillatoria salina]|uniref:VWA domain-containing protein n=1 Tax=Oscillatoria salina TaxID=331517 RepID=UPI0013BBBCFA|nr:VWA domain-containing protein [Oscillatoria salina]MBZ8181733.1 VWA domain-containing protein [Oscillatoria salina IIICB1]NET89902.1 VWA domain-containing protein [Kamptonema sp. SIO1D9]
MTFSRRPLWLYPLFQIPLILLGIFLATALLFWLFGIGRPNVAVAIGLDLSTSTYAPQEFNAPGTVMSQEVAAVRSYLDINDRLLRQPNQVQVFGFGGVTISLTGDFQTDSQKINAELTQALQDPNLPQSVANESTDINLAIQSGINALSQISDRCREFLLVTDGGAPVSAEIIANARSQRVKINTVIIGGESLELRAAAFATRGNYHTTASNNLETLFTERLFTSFNSNLKWIIFWLGAAWIALMWTLVLPLDRWLFQNIMQMPINLAGQLALGNAFFWTAATPGIIIGIYRLLNLSGLPFFSSC